MPPFAQRSFAAGEIAPALRARTDYERYITGLATCRNMYPRKAGGVISRPGTIYMGESRHHDKDVRLIPWVFNETQTYVIELADQLIRIIDGSTNDYLFTAKQNIEGVTQASPGVITLTGHGYATDDVIKIEDVSGMWQLNDRYFRVVNITADTFSLKEMDGTAVNTTGYDAWAANGTCKEPFSIAAANAIVTDTVPYLEAELPYITFTQSGDVMTLCHTSHAPRDLVRNDGGATATSWRLLTKNFGTSLTAPDAAPTLTDEPGPTDASYDYSPYIWLTTCINAQGDESSRSAISIYTYPRGDSDAIGTSTKPAAYSGSTKAYSLALDGDIGTGVGGPVDITAGVEFGAYITVTSTSDDDWSSLFLTIVGLTFEGVMSEEVISGPKAYGQVSFKAAYKRIDRILATGLPGGSDTLEVGVDEVEIFPIAITSGDKTEDTVTGYRLYRANIYNKTSNKPYYGFVAESIDVQGSASNIRMIHDDGGTPDFTRPPPEPMYTLTGARVFESANNYPAVVAYYQQRLILARTINEPESVWMSRTGLYYVPDDLTTPTAHYANFDVRLTVNDDNAIQFNIASLQLDRPLHFLDLGRLFIFTDKGEWIVEGDSAGVITPSQINPRKFSYSGSGYLRPLPVHNTALFVQGNRRTVRDLVYDQQSTGYQGSDLSVFSQHLTDSKTIEDWTYQQDPDSLVWMVLSDGTMLSLTYLRDYNIMGWARHDTQGTSAEFVSVCSIPNGAGRDDVYVAVKRTVNGRVFRSIEYFGDRLETKDGDLVSTDATVIVSDPEVLCAIDNQPGSGQVEIKESGVWRDEDIAGLTNEVMECVHVFRPDNIWIGGGGAAGALLRQFQGSGWTDRTTAEMKYIWAISGTSASAFCVVGEDTGGWAAAWIWNGVSFAYTRLPQLEDNPTTSTGGVARCVHFVSSTEIYVGGDNNYGGTGRGGIWKWDGSTWFILLDCVAYDALLPDRDPNAIIKRTGDTLPDGREPPTGTANHIWVGANSLAGGAMILSRDNGVTWTRPSSTDGLGLSGTIKQFMEVDGELWCKDDNNQLSQLRDYASNHGPEPAGGYGYSPWAAGAWVVTSLGATNTGAFWVGHRRHIWVGTENLTANLRVQDGTDDLNLDTYPADDIDHPGYWQWTNEAMSRAIRVHAIHGNVVVPTLWHLEGYNVSVRGSSVDDLTGQSWDTTYTGNTIIASPYNDDYDLVTVSGGQIDLPRFHKKLHIGLPIVHDVETLRIDPADANVMGEKRIATGVDMHLNRSSRCFVGTDEPPTATSLSGLTYFDILGEAGVPNQSGGESILTTGINEVSIEGEWDYDGAVFVRHVDPVPLSVLAIAPHTAVARPEGGD